MTIDFDPWGKTDHDADPDPEATLYEANAAFARAVTEEERRILVRQAARLKVARSERADLERPKLQRLDHFLGRPFDDPTYRINDLWPTGGRVLMAAQWKAGKTTVVLNLLRALVDGEAFLGKYLPRQARNVVLIDDELDERTLALWLRDMNITNTDRIQLLSLRGRVGTFDILDPDARSEWAKDLTGADVVILDCLRPIFDAFGLDENHEAGRFLVALDTLLADAGIDEAAVIHHMGHSGERSRGDSRLLDWPDALWKLVRDKDDESDGELDDPQGSRYFSAYGRDVDVAQVEMVFDKPTRRLTLGSKTRHQATADRRIVKAEEAVARAVAAKPGLTKNALFKACHSWGVKDKSQVIDAVDRLVEDGLILRQIKGQGHYHYPMGNAADTLMSDSDQSSHGRSVNEPLTRDNAATDLDSDRSVQPGQTKATDLPDLFQSRSVDQQPPVTDLRSRSEIRSVIDHPHSTETDRSVDTKTCPSCGTNTIPTTFTRCQPCADDIATLAATDRAEGT